MSIWVVRHGGNRSCAQIGTASPRSKNPLRDSIRKGDGNKTLEMKIAELEETLYNTFHEYVHDSELTPPQEADLLESINAIMERIDKLKGELVR
jgi:hypothetical protein